MRTPRPLRRGFYFVGLLMRTTFLIDGFNFYHSIEKLDKKFRWIDYKRLCSHFLAPGDMMEEIYYFTAIAEWRSPESRQRHKVFIDAVKNQEIRVVLGKFKEKTRKCQSRHKITRTPGKCPGCPQKFTAHEEKATDVNIALYSYKLAHLDTFDKLILVTGDTDLVPAIKMVKTVFPSKRIEMLYPYGRANNELSQASDHQSFVKVSHLESFQLPEIITLTSGRRLFRPPTWR